jgi:peptidoglycan/xylan/chitin deacetylase (PgdA/CDA1 family)
LIHTFRKILCISLLGLLALPGAAGAGGGRPEVAVGSEVAIGSDLAQAGLAQAGRSLIASVWTRKPVPLSAFDPLPKRGGNAQYLCFSLARLGRGGERRLCLGGSKNAHHRVGLLALNASGKTISERTLAARVKRPDPKHLVVTLLPGAAGLAPQRYDWRVLELRARCGGTVRDCESRLPPGRSVDVFRLRPVRPVGCTGGSAGLVTNGPRDRPVVALTFDDGPSEYTPGFLDVLREKHVPATFFEIGQEMAGREDTMRRILSEGDEIGNHTMHHTEYPGYSEIAPDSALIERYTHFAPCLFRPPGGGADSSVISTAASLGMQTITWDVDPRDWTTPGSAAVYSRVVGAARPGSIILMHDGGGPRGGTLTALPAIIDTLRGRGYGFATVSALLGHRLVYRPYG